MRNFKIVVLLVFLFLLLANGVQATLFDGLAAYYTFDGNALDSSGNGNHGNFNNATYSTDRFGNPNSAAVFNQLGDTYVRVADSQSLDITGPITLATWVNADIYQYFRVGLIHKRAPSEPSGGYHLMLRGETGQDMLADFQLVITNNPLPVVLAQLQSNTIVNDNSWHHIAGTYDGTTMKMYIDGTLESTLAWSTGYVENDEPLHIGLFTYDYNDGHGNEPNILNGLMDDVRIYNRALSPSEVQGLSSDSGNAPVPEPGTILLFGLGLLGVSRARKNTEK